MIIASIVINILTLVAISALAKMLIDAKKDIALINSKASQMEFDRKNFLSNIELVVDTRQMALYNAIEAKLAATKSHVMDSKRIAQELPEFIKKEIKGELGQIRLLQSNLMEAVELFTGKSVDNSPNKSAHN